MKKLVNNVDREIVFYNLEEAKKYFSAGSTCPVENEYLGEDFPGYCQRYAEYLADIEASETLEELARVLNSNTDEFEDGRGWKVVEF